MTATTLTTRGDDRGLEVSGVHVGHGPTTLVDVADLAIEPGRPLTVVGESGSGKSLLAHALLGTLPPELEVRGTMRFGGRVFDLADRGSRRALWGRGLALLPQEPSLALDPTMRVRGQVVEGVPDFGSRGSRARALADAALARVGLAGSGDSYPHTLSGGMAQRAAYAAATVGGSRLLVVDEPTKGLDQDSVDRLADHLAAHAADGLLLTITHDLRLARRLGGDVVVMREAVAVERGPAERVLTAPAHPWTRRLVAAEPAHWTHPWLDTGARGGTPLVTADGITKAYGDHVLFEDLSLRLGAGERWALHGPSGAGKTTLGNALLRLSRVDRGTVTHSSALAGGRVQKLYQDPSLSFPPRVSLEVALADVAGRHGVARDRVEALMERVGVPPSLLVRRPGQVSGGELQRVAVVRALLPGPALVLADEATSRLDLVTQETTTDGLMNELDALGCGLVWVTHDRDLAEAVADHHLELGPEGATTRGVVPA